MSDPTKEAWKHDPASVRSARGAAGLRILNKKMVATMVPLVDGCANMLNAMKGKR